ncbi:MAG: ABC transporter ATP-binding protein, partial [Holophagae bacterium]|nr:ABC transporter ATP-binding protein [Holophagae bacterium]
MSNGGIPLALRISGLTKSFPGFQLGPFDLDLEPGRVLGFVGPNGAGKTTTFNCVAGLLRPDAGDIELLGRPSTPGDARWRDDLGHVGEVGGFYADWTTGRNLDLLASFHAAWSRRRAIDLAERFGLPLDRKVKDLSKGNQAKLALVAALGHDPRLLLLDEPTAGL